MYCLGSLGHDRAYEIQVGDDEGGGESTVSVALFRGDQALALWLSAEQIDGFIDALTRARRALPLPFPVGVTGHPLPEHGANTSS